MPPKRKGLPPVNANRRPKIAGSARSLNVPAGPSPTAREKAVIPDPAVVGPDVTPVSLDKSADVVPAEELQKPAEPASEPPASEPPASESAAELDAEGPSELPGAERAEHSPWRLVAGLGAATAVVAVLAGLAYFEVGVQMDDVAWVDASATAEVLRVAPPALEAVFTFAPDTFDADFDKGVQGLNQAMRDQLTEYKDTQKAGVEQTQTATAADVTEIGVTRLEANRAQLLAQLNVSSTQGGVAAGSRSGMVVVSLEKTDGNWLISEIRDR